MLSKEQTCTSSMPAMLAAIRISPPFSAKLNSKKSSGLIGLSNSWPIVSSRAARVYRVAAVWFQQPWMGQYPLSKSSSSFTRVRSTLVNNRQPASTGSGCALQCSEFVDLAGAEENPMKSIPALAFLFVSSVAYAQTTGTPAPATSPPAAEAGDGLGWLWLLVLLAIIAAVVWYFMKKRGATTASSVAGVNRTAAGTTIGPTATGTTGSSNPPAGPNVYPAKDPKDLNR
jgi:hypothetical protein